MNGFLGVGISMDGYTTLADVSWSLTLGSLLNPIMGFSEKGLDNSSLFLIIFQLSLIRFFITVFSGLYVRTISGLSVLLFYLTVSTLPCEKSLAVGKGLCS